MANRVKWIDIAKGITILLVIVGHTIGGTPGASLMRGGIFSFHMPLFFIMNGLTSTCSDNWAKFYVRIKKGFIRLIVPALVLFSINSVIAGIQQSNTMTVAEFSKECFLSLLYSSGVTVTIFDHQISAVGIIWFLVVLFSTRTIYDLLSLCLSSSRVYMVVILLSVMGVFLGYKCWLPFSLDISFAVLPFVLLGDKLKVLNWDVCYRRKAVVSTIVWLGIFLLMYCYRDSYMEIAKRHYTLFPMCFICAAAGTLTFSYISMMISSCKGVSTLLEFIGRHSMCLMFIHVLDEHFSIAWQLTDSCAVNSLARLNIDVLVALLVLLLIRKIRCRMVNSHSV